MASKPWVTTMHLLMAEPIADKAYPIGVFHQKDKAEAHRDQMLNPEDPEETCSYEERKLNIHTVVVMDSPK